MLLSNTSHIHIEYINVIILAITAIILVISTLSFFDPLSCSGTSVNNPPINGINITVFNIIFTTLFYSSTSTPVGDFVCMGYPILCILQV